MKKSAIRRMLQEGNQSNNQWIAETRSDVEVEGRTCIEALIGNKTPDHIHYPNGVHWPNN